MNVDKITLAQTLPLRQKYLRPFQSVEQCQLPEDEHADACHFGAFQNGVLVGVCSIYPDAFPNAYASKSPSKKSWRLRMMATEEKVRHQGFGKALVLAVERYLSEQAGETLWCHARASALSFYEVLGFKIDGDVFEIENIGPHLLMHKSLAKIKK